MGIVRELVGGVLGARLGSPKRRGGRSEQKADGDSSERDVSDRSKLASAVGQGLGRMLGGHQDAAAPAQPPQAHAAEPSASLDAEQPAAAPAAAAPTAAPPALSAAASGDAELRALLARCPSPLAPAEVEEVLSLLAAAKINAATIVATAAADGQTLVTTLKEAGVAPGWALQIMLAARAQ
ncbi:hypothetical protein C2E20_3129 [Micractinium conductrix]|uniref:Uncharacterized protein n=1 Tax=Micractinium conductrix TaxID=554055 RepID=A0A2P6VHI9_9CHLO|nr:hypothetical protein C2E20_3129 [Micractinium conductrix]|eukprot:PSC73561.1 hypothetical protein C2E20_3129 [Micractinium conductrix]